MVVAATEPRRAGQLPRRVYRRARAGNQQRHFRILEEYSALFLG
jgi:hypothetical protein